MIPNWLSWVDVTFFCVALLFAWGGFQKGFAAQIAPILAFVVLGLVLFFVYPVVFNYFDRIFRDVNEVYLRWLILAGLLVLSRGIFLLSSTLLARGIKTQLSDRSDHVNGFVLGLVRGLLAALFIMIFLVLLAPSTFYDTFRMKSKVGKLVCYQIIPRIQPHLVTAQIELHNKWLERKEAGVFE